MKAAHSGHKGFLWLLAPLALAGMLGLFVVSGVTGSPAAPAAAPATATPALPYREVGGEQIEAPHISAIDSPSATCSLPVPGTAACYIAWSYLNVTAASGSYIISMTVSIDNRVRAYNAGFFQNAMYIPGEMMGPGFQVTCGPPGSGAVAGMGKTYNYVIRARETGGLSSANYGSVTCPADIVHVYLPMVRKR